MLFASICFNIYLVQHYLCPVPVSVTFDPNSQTNQIQSTTAKNEVMYWLYLPHEIDSQVQLQYMMTMMQLYANLQFYKETLLDLRIHLLKGFWDEDVVKSTWRTRNLTYVEFCPNPRLPRF